MEVCTIIAKNYLAHARVLARSLAEHQPGARLWTLIIDDFARYVDPAGEPFEVLAPGDIGCDAFTHMAMRYSVLELSTAVKPWLLRHLLVSTGGPVTYLDPDIKIYGPIDALDRAAAEHGVALIPHNDVPLPDDGLRPSQIDVMIAGVYNLGYVSVSAGPAIDRLLDWWSDRLLRDCRVDPVWGYFVDQRWFDLVPGFLDDVAIIRDPEFNVAYWNLHSRRLGLAEGRYTVDGRPLAFFHFSGFDPEHPDQLSRHQNRIATVEQPVLPRILAEYATDLEAAGHRVSRSWPYSFHALADGTPIDDTVRALYDEYATEHDEQVPSPFTLAGAREFESWWATQAPGAPTGINRVLASMYEQRSDLRAAFPELGGEGTSRLLTWAGTAGVAQSPLLARAMAAAVRLPGPNGGDPVRTRRPTRINLRAAAGPLPWGVNLVGDFHSGLESGQLARGLLRALDASAIPVLPVQAAAVAPRPTWVDFPTASLDEAAFAINLLVLDPDALPELAGHAGATLLARRYTAALALVSASELTGTTVAGLGLVDELWAPSEYVADALAAHAGLSAYRAVLPVDSPAASPTARDQLGVPTDEFLFLAMVDHDRSFAAQNPMAAIEAFAAAFDDRAWLLIAHRNADQDRGAHAELVSKSAAHPRVTLVAADEPSLELRALVSTCDCVVSLHRELAFGFELADAMAGGKPVIATGYSGNLEFMTAGNSLLVEHELVAVASRDLQEGVQWAQPDLDHAARLMRAVVEDRELTARLAAAGAASVLHHHSARAAGAYLAARLGEIRARGLTRPPASMGARPARLGKVSLRLAEGPVARPGAAGGAARESLRKAVLRIMQPYTAYQHQVNSDLLAAVEDLCDLFERNSTSRLGQAMLMAQSRRTDEIVALARHHDEILKGVDMRELSAGIDHIKRLLTEDSDRSTYLALAELSRRHREVGADPGEAPADRGLAGHELRAFSQNGEDGVVAEILRRIGAPARSFVEFGIESGREGNCVYLADVAGWSGLFIEADGDCFDALQRKYAAQDQVQTARAMVTPENVEELFEASGVPAEPDVVTIDVDGSDYWIWEALENFRPRLLIIEYNSSLDPRRRLVQPRDLGGWDGTSYYGASLGALAALGERKGYQLVHTERSGANAFFVREDLLGESFPAPDEVARRGYPNYFARGYRHPPPDPTRRYLDLDSGELVSAVS